MQLQKLAIQNYRLLVDAELDVDPKTTLIVGRNNTAKTSCFACIEKVLKGERFSFDDYPLSKRADLYTKIALFMEKKLSYEDLCNQMALVSVEFLVDYSLDNPDEPLGALSPFIIDIDIDSTTALIRVEYQLKTDEKTLWSDLEKGYYPTGVFSPTDETHALIAECFSKRFGHTVYAINPKNHNDRQVKSLAELQELFPIYNIPAERVLGEDATHNSSLSSLITSFFNTNEDDLDPEVGAYAHIFIPFVEFLEIPCLIITDIDSVCRRKAVSVSQGTTSSNATIKWWVRKNKGRPASDTTRIPLAEIMAMTDVKKTRGKCRIEFQTTENSLCGRSLEEAIKNVNRALYGLPATATEENIAYTGTCKTDFALDLIYNCHDYVIPAYIKSGLIWLNAQKTSE